MSNGSLAVEKNPAKVAAGRAGAASRWGPPRVVRIDQLTPEQRRLVVALIEAAKAGKAGDDAA
jgi:hypothetical protein